MSQIDDVWNNELSEMLQANPDLQPKTLLIHLQRTYLDESNNPIYQDSVLRTLQRRVAKEEEACILIEEVWKKQERANLEEIAKLVLRVEKQEWRFRTKN